MASVGGNLGSFNDLMMDASVRVSSNIRNLSKLEIDTRNFERAANSKIEMNLEGDVSMVISAIPDRFSSEQIRKPRNFPLDPSTGFLNGERLLFGSDEYQPLEGYPCNRISKSGTLSAPVHNISGESKRNFRIACKIKRSLSFNIKKRRSISLSINKRLNPTATAVIGSSIISPTSNNTEGFSDKKSSNWSESLSSVNISAITSTDSRGSGDYKETASLQKSSYLQDGLNLKRSDQRASNQNDDTLSADPNFTGEYDIVGESCTTDDKTTINTEGEVIYPTSEYAPKKDDPLNTQFNNTEFKNETHTHSMQTHNGDTSNHESGPLVADPNDGNSGKSHLNFDCNEGDSIFKEILRRNNERIGKQAQSQKHYSNSGNNIKMWARLSTVLQSDSDGPSGTDELYTSSAYHKNSKCAKDTTMKLHISKVNSSTANISTGDTANTLLRLLVLEELIKTEKNYVSDLEIILQKFFIPIHSSEIITQEEERKLFSNLEAIYEVNNSFLNRLLERQRTLPDLNEVADILVEFVRDLYVYSDYCSNYPTAIRISKKLLDENKELRSLVTTALKDPEVRGLSFGSFLIKPVQRICKYPLLIKDLSKYTSKISKETIHIKLALEKLDEVIRLINNSTQVLDEDVLYASIISKVNPPLPLSLQGKRLIREGYLNIYSSLRMKKRYCVLLEDAFIVFKPMKDQTLKWLDIITLDYHITVVISEETLKTVMRMYKAAFKISVSNQCFERTFVASSEIEKVKWMESIDYTIKKCKRDYDEGKYTPNRKSMCYTMIDSVRGDNETYDGEFNNLSIYKRCSSNRRFSLGRGIYNCIPIIGNKSKSAVTISLPVNNDKQAWAGSSKNDSDVSMSNCNSQFGRSPWREAFSAIGIKYYYNIETKESRWLLPQDRDNTSRDNNTPNKAEDTPSTNRTISVDSISSETHSNTPQEIPEPSVLSSIAQHVEGHSNWYYMHATDDPYYFNIVTKESCWNSPEENVS